MQLNDDGNMLTERWGDNFYEMGSKVEYEQYKPNLIETRISDICGWTFMF